MYIETTVLPQLPTPIPYHIIRANPCSSVEKQASGSWPHNSWKFV